MHLYLSLLPALLLPLSTTPCQPRKISCLPSATEKLECFCSGIPQPSSIQNIMEEVTDHLQTNTSALTVRSCADEHYSVRLDLGQRHQSKDLEVRPLFSMELDTSKPSNYLLVVVFYPNYD